MSDRFKVRIRSRGNGKAVVFLATPTISENRRMTYAAKELTHMPGTIYSYTNTSSRTFSIGDIQLISRTTSEATKNTAIVQTIRAWGMPYSGMPAEASLLGYPPDVLELTAYAEDNKPGAIYQVPVLLTNYTMDYPNNVDYIPTDTGEPWPVKMTMTVDLVETHSPVDFLTFDVSAYHEGKMLQW